MTRSVWGSAVEWASFLPVVLGGTAASVVGGIWSAAQGEGFEKGADRVMDTVIAAAEGLADFADAHKDELNKATKTLVLTAAAQVAGDKAVQLSRRYL